MTVDAKTKELVKRLREGDITMKCEDGVVRYCNHVAADALEALVGEVERLKGVLGEEERACEKAIITATKAEYAAAEAKAERDRLKAALEPFAKLETCRGAHDPAEGTMRMRVVTVPEIEAARKALGDAS